jgi:hypothetical protein
VHLAFGLNPTWIKSRKIIFRNFTIVSKDLERRCAYGGNEGRGERCTFRTLKKGSEVPSLYVRNVSAALGRFGSGANPLQPLPATNGPRSLARLKKGRSDAHHRDGQGKEIITHSNPQGAQGAVLMPYKDPELRKRASRESKRRARARGTLPEFRAYIFPKQPFFRIGPSASFENGLLVVSDPLLQNMVEAHREFGRNIFRVALITGE